MTLPARSVVFPSVVRWILIVSAIVYSVTLAVVLWNTPEAIRDMGEGSHRQAAYHLMDTGSYPTITHRVPGYPALIAALYSLFGRDNDIPLVLLIGATSLATIYLTFRIGRHFFGSRGGAIAAAIVAADVCLLYRSYSVDMPDALLAFLVTGASLVVLRCLKEDASVAAFAMTAVLFCICALVKPIAVNLSILVLAVLIGHSWWNGWVKSRIRHLAVYTGTVVLLLVGWQTRNYVASGHFVFSPMKGLYFVYVKAYILGEKENVPFSEMLGRVRAEYAAKPRTGGPGPRW